MTAQGHRPLQPLQPLATVAAAGFVPLLLAQAGMIWGHFVEAGDIARLQSGALLPLGDVQRLHDLYRAAGYLRFGALVLAFALFVGWMKRCAENVEALGQPRLRYAASLVRPITWLLPIFDLVVPLQMMNDLAKAAPRTRRPLLPALTWFAWLLAALLIGIEEASVAKSSPLAAHRLGAVADTLGALAAVLTMVLIGRVTRAIEELAATAPPPPPPPLLSPRRPPPIPAYHVP